GYGGKPPGVAFIGVPTGARNAGRCSDGGPEHRYACYTETPPCASRPDYKPSGQSHARLAAVQPFPGRFSGPVSWLNACDCWGVGGVASGSGGPAAQSAV